MLSSANILYVIGILGLDFGEAFGIPDQSDYIAFLPLAHIAEQEFTIFGVALTERSIYYCRDPTQLASVLAVVKPHLFFAPPRVWEKFYSGISANLPPGMSIADLPPQNKVGILTKMGLDRVKLAITGAAPISANILNFFDELGIPVHEIYGQSEGSGPTSINLPGQRKLGSVGRTTSLRETEVVVSDDGELLLRGPQVFLGYWNQPELTAETLDSNGFLHSGDLCRIDEDGFIFINGRKKRHNYHQWR
jgi:long-chain acyl-CoA synthetase